MKKTTSALVLAVAGMVLGANIAMADSGSSSSAEITSTVRTCVASAVATREAALSAGLTDFNAQVVDAYADRASALASAWSGTKTRAEIKTDVKNAWSAFKSAIKTARADWKSDKKNAWSTFKSSVKTCRAPADTVDTSSQGSEV